MDMDQVIGKVTDQEIHFGGAFGRPTESEVVRTCPTPNYGQPFCWGQCLELQAGRDVPILNIKESVSLLERV